MGRSTTWFLLAGVLLAALLPAEALKGTTIVINKLKGKQGDGSPLPSASPAPLAESRSDVDVDPPTGEGEEAAAGNATTKSPLTGIPQIDYVHDPNLPRELNGYNLTEYPFYDRVPEEIDFKCDGLHDGFYASIPHKCQVYHHCLFGTRYDFLCANYTAFDQKTFICHFVSEVDCVNSPKYFKRNEALYKAASTAAPSTTTQAPTPPPPPQPIRRPLATSAGATAPGGRRRRPYRRRRPVYDYYYDEDYEDDPDYYEDDLPGQQGGSAAAPPPPPPRRRRKRPRPQQRPQPAQEYEDQPETVQDPAAVMPGDSKPRSSSSVYSRPRVPPKIRPPVPLNERDKYDYKKSAMPLAESAEDPRPTNVKTSTAAPPADDYYDDEEEYAPPARGAQGSKPRNPDYYPPPSNREVVRRPAMAPAGRPARRNRPSAPRRRPADTALPLEDAADDYYDDPYEQDPPPPPPPRRRPANGRKRIPASSTRQEPEPYYRQPTRAQAEEDYTPPRKQAPAYSQRGGVRYEDEEDDLPVPAPRPAYISTAPANPSAVRQMHRKRIPPPEDDYEPYNRRPVSQSSRKQTVRQPVPATYEDSAEYYDDEVEQEPVQTSSRPRPKQQSGFRQPAPTTAAPAPLPRPSPAAPVSKEVEDEEDIIIPPSRTPSRPFLPSRGGSSTLPRGLQPLGAKAESSSPKSSSGYRTRIDDSQAPAAKPSKEGEAAKLPTEFRAGGGGIASARPKTQSGGDDLGARTSGKYKPSSARAEPAKNDLSNAKTSPPLQPVKTPLPHIIKNDQPRTNLADIEDYDVSLNDALHPSLQSTRSVATGIVSFPAQLAPSRPQSFRSTGRGGSPLVTAASQRQITRAPYEPEVGQTYLQPARKRQQYSEVDLAPPPVQQQQYRVDGQPLSLTTRGREEEEEEEDERLYVSPSRGYSRDY